MQENFMMTLMRKVLACICIATVQGLHPVSFASAQTVTPAPAVASTAPPQDPGWPRQIVKNGATLIYYQPQIDEWKDLKTIAGRAAFTLTPANGKQAQGVVSFESGTEVNQESRTVYLKDLKYTSVRFPSLDAQAASQMEQTFRSIAPNGVNPISLDRLMADVDRSKISAQAPPLKTDPPQIFYSSTPAILLMVQGKPVLRPLG